MILSVLPASLLSFVFVALILVAMASVLLGIHNIFIPEDKSKERGTDKLKQEVENQDDVMTGGSVFHNFLARDVRQPRNQSRKAASAESTRKAR